ncbi:MAG: EAL domain-containing protein, partial [Pseudomonadota bacterium]
MEFDFALGASVAPLIVGGSLAEGAAADPGDLVRGAIGGAFVIGIAFLAGFAVFRRSAAAVCALFMVAAAAALQFNWLGFFQTAPETVVTLLQGVFAASVLIFLSATVDAARRNPIIGGLMFAAALSFVGLGLINFLGRVDAAALMQTGLIGVGVFAAAFAAWRAVAGDQAARLMTPGVAIALAAPLTAEVFGAGSLAPHALFAFGVLAASLVALTEGAGVAARDFALAETSAAFADDRAPDDETAKLLVSENQLAQVLDYSGVAVWDWSPGSAHQTETFAALFGAKAHQRTAPHRLMDAIRDSDRARFEEKVFGREEGDGAFDVTVRSHEGQAIRLRGARAVSDNGSLERLVLFAEKAADDDAPSLWNTAAGAAALATTATAASTAAGAASERKAASRPDEKADPRARAVATALDGDLLEAAFQPIVSLIDQSVSGYEALVRAADRADGLDGLTTEEIVEAAEAAGRGGDLASMMLTEATAFLADKIRARKRKELFVAMNVSFAQIREASFVGKVETAIREHALPKKALVLELTESEAVDDDKVAREAFSKLAAAGAALAFDDFGAGFSSLSNLRKFSFDYLKVDKSFVEKLADDDGAKKIVAAMAGLGKDLGLTVIAEGVASTALAEAAQKCGCRLGQGFAFGEAERVARKAAATPAA